MSKRPGPSTTQRLWEFVLYRAGDNPAMGRAERGLRKLCEEYVPDRFAIEVIDVGDPDAEVPNDVLAVPLVVRKSPTPQRRVVGDLSDSTKAAEFLELTTAHLLQD